MITQIEAKNFRCLREVNQSLGAFLMLVGPNASGKTTFLDVFALLGRLVSSGLEAAITERSHNFSDLLWGKSGTQFDLAIEASIPERLQEKLFDKIRYEVTIGMDAISNETLILAETVFF
jgi:AAA15 family ATPase/GTPase